MGTSYIEYKGSGYWSRDSFISEWLEVLLRELEERSSTQAWERALIEEWSIQKEIDGGVISLQLDKFLPNAENRDVLLSLAAAALPKAPKDAQRTGELFIDLLREQLRTTASSPIDYL